MLTPAGATQIEDQARFYRAAGLSVDHVLTSPLVRARTTAERVAEALGTAVRVEPVLRCGFGFDAAVELLGGAYREAQALLLVGHQPDLGHLVRILTGNEIPVHPGTLVALDVDALRPRGARLVALFDPALAAQAGRTLAGAP